MECTRGFEVWCTFKTIEELDNREELRGFDQNQRRNLFLGFQDEIMNKIGGERGESSNEVGRDRSSLGFIIVGTR